MSFLFGGNLKKRSRGGGRRSTSAVGRKETRVFGGRDTSRGSPRREKKKESPQKSTHCFIPVLGQTGCFLSHETKEGERKVSCERESGGGASR